MQKKDLYAQLLSHVHTYRLTHSRTAEMDLEIVQKLSSGKNIVQTTMEVPCSEATVYRAVNRVRQFLLQINKPCLTAGPQNAAQKKKS